MISRVISEGGKSVEGREDFFRRITGDTINDPVLVIIIVATRGQVSRLARLRRRLPTMLCKIFN